jgi:hypothetical protein
MYTLITQATAYFVTGDSSFLLAVMQHAAMITQHTLDAPCTWKAGQDIEWLSQSVDQIQHTHRKRAVHNN